MSEGLSLDLTATRDALRQALETIEHYCRGRNVARDQVMRLLVIVEELVTNTIKYGYGGECDRPVRLCLVCGECVVLTVEDEAPEFDPTLWNTAPVLGAAPDQRPIGQTGIALALGLAAAARYERRHGANRLVLELKG